MRLLACGFVTDSLRVCIAGDERRIIIDHAAGPVVLCADRYLDDGPTMTFADVVEYVRDKLETIVDEASTSLPHRNAASQPAAYVGDTLSDRHREARESRKVSARMEKDIARKRPAPPAGIIDGMRWNNKFLSADVRDGVHMVPSFADIDEARRFVLDAGATDGTTAVIGEEKEFDMPAHGDDYGRAGWQRKASVYRSSVGNLIRRYDFVALWSGPDTPYRMTAFCVRRTKPDSSDAIEAIDRHVQAILRDMLGTVPPNMQIVYNEKRIPRGFMFHRSFECAVTGEGENTAVEDTGSFGMLAEELARLTNEYASVYVHVETYKLDEGLLDIDLFFPGGEED